MALDYKEEEYGMSEELENSVRNMLSANLSRASIENFEPEKLEEFSAIIQQAKDTEAEYTIVDICDEQLQTTRECVPALFIKGMLKLHERAYENNELRHLIDLFEKNHKPKIVEAICKAILQEDDDNLFALSKQAEYLKNDGKPEYWANYEKIVQLNGREADLALQLAKHYSDENDTKKAKSYYKQAIVSYIDTAPENIVSKNWDRIHEIWSTLIDVLANDNTKLDFFLMLQKKIAKNVGEDKSATLMMDLYRRTYKDTDTDVAIDILKLVFSITGDNPSYRAELVECYRKKYQDVAKVDDYIRASDLEGHIGRDIFICIDKFEKLIAFSAGNFVFHRTWGVGYIESLQGNTLTINFGGNVGKKQMRQEMAETVLKPLPKDHIWVLKATKTPTYLQDMVGLDREPDKKDKDSAKKVKDSVKKLPDNVKRKRIAKTLETIIKSFDNQCDMKRIKAELVPAIIKDSKWNNWHAIANEILTAGSTDGDKPYFAVSPDDITIYTVRRNKLEMHEKLYIEFKAEKEFFPKSDILMKLLELYKTADVDDKIGYRESLNEMFKYFVNFLNSTPSDNDNEQMTKWLASYLIVQTIVEVDGNSGNYHIPDGFTFRSIYEKLNKTEGYSARIAYKELQGRKNTNLRDRFLKDIQNFLTDCWDDEYIKLFPVVADFSQDTDKNNAASFITKELAAKYKSLIEKSEPNKLTRLVKDCFEDFKNNRNAVIFLFKEHKGEKEGWYHDAEIPYDRQLQTLLHIIDYSAWEIANHKDTPENKKTINKARNILFGKKKEDQNLILNYILGKNEDGSEKAPPQEPSEEEALRFFTMVNDISDLDYKDYKLPLRIKIQEKWPNFKFPVMEAKQQEAKNVIYATEKALKEKEAEVTKLKQDIEVDNVAIAEARKHGDFSENAELDSAKKDKQVHSRQLSELQKTIARAERFDPMTITTAIISFGTKVTLHDNRTGQDIMYTILGPFESAPEDGILSYLSPLGAKLLNHKAGEHLVFDVNGTAYDFTVSSIEAADLS